MLEEARWTDFELRNLVDADRLLRVDLIPLHLVVGSRGRVLQEIVELGLIAELVYATEACAAVAEVVRNGFVEVFVELARVGKREAVAARLTADRGVRVAVILRRLRRLVNDRLAQRFVRRNADEWAIVGLV